VKNKRSQFWWTCFEFAVPTQTSAYWCRSDY